MDTRRKKRNEQERRTPLEFGRRQSSLPPGKLSLRCDALKAFWSLTGDECSGDSDSRGTRRFEVPQRELQSAEVGMVVVADGECDVDGIARQERRLLQAFGHVPAEGVKYGSQFSVLSSQLKTFGFGFLFAADRGAVRMTTWRGQD